MKKVFVVIFLGLVLGLYGYLRANPAMHQQLIERMNEDTIYLKNGTILHGWIWDDGDGVVVGEGEAGDIFILQPSEYKKIDRDVILTYVRELR